MTSLARELIIFVAAIILFGVFTYFVITPRLLALLNKFGDSFVCPLLWLIERHFKGMASKPPRITQTDNDATQINPPNDIKIAPQKFICFINNIPKILTHQMELFRRLNSRNNNHRRQGTKQPISQFTKNEDENLFHSPDSNIVEKLKSTKRELNPLTHN